MKNKIPRWFTPELAQQMLKWVESGESLPSWLTYGNRVTFERWLRETTILFQDESLETKSNKTSEEWIDLILHRLNLKQGRGRDYVKWCLKQELSTTDFLENNATYINQKVAEQFNTTKSGAHAAMLRVVQTAWYEHSNEIREKFNGRSVDVKSYLEFLRETAEYLKSEMSKEA